MGTLGLYWLAVFLCAFHVRIRPRKTRLGDVLGLPGYFNVVVVSSKAYPHTTTVGLPP